MAIAPQLRRSSLRRIISGTALVGALAAAAFGAGATSAGADPAPNEPNPTVSSVQARLAALARKNEDLTEAYNKARIDATAKKRAADAADRSAKQAAAHYNSARRTLNATILAQYKSVGTGQTSALLTSRSGQNYVDQVTTLDILGDRRSDVVTDARTAKTDAADARKRADSLAADAAKRVTSLSAQKDSLQGDIDKYQALLNTLNAQQRKAVVNAIGGTSPSSKPIPTAPVPAPSKKAGIAVAYALAQQGKPYVFAASGPSAFDCSGLTAAAWEAAGVSLPHFAATQYDYGTHVAESQLEPGDLVFFYQPIGHVGMYIGNGLIVHAPEPGDVVKVVPLSVFSSDYVGATRLG